MNTIAVRAEIGSARGRDRPISLYSSAARSLPAGVRSCAKALCEQSRDAQSLHIGPTDIVRDMLLHCGGLGHEPTSDTAILRACKQSLGRLMVRRRGLADLWLSWDEEVNVKRTLLQPVPADLSRVLFESLHYLGSWRSGGSYYGLYPEFDYTDSEVPICLCSLHPFDLHHLVPAPVSKQVAQNSVVLSRLLALPRAPKNALSRLLGLLCRQIGDERSDTTHVLTYNNPNLGFAGTIYRASNWNLVGYDVKRPDLLLDGLFVTLRELHARFGTFDANVLKDKLGDRLEILPPPLAPLELYGREIRAARKKWAR